MLPNVYRDFLFMTVIIGLITSCKETAVKEVEQTSVIEEIMVPNIPKEADENLTQVYYPWVDQLKIRDRASTNGKVVAVVQSSDVLTYENEISKDSLTVVLRGVAYHEPWIKIRTYNDKIGWVFKGAVKHKDERKGNEPISDTQITFDYFGTFDLAEWKLIDSSISYEELDERTYVYARGNRRLELSQMDMGEFYYGYEQTLKSKAGEIQRQRLFDFTVDDGTFKMIEQVINTKERPYTIYSREQYVNEHYYQLNAKPMMVNGTWTRNTMNVEEMDRFDTTTE